jgi:sugar/nucleoside kinase (ribokinase family)
MASMPIPGRAAGGGPHLLVVGFVYVELLLPPDAATPPPGEEAFVDELRLGVGGALNAASVAHALGSRTAVSFPSPNGPFGGVAREAAAQLGIESHPWPTPIEPPVSLIFSHRMDRAILSFADFEAFRDCPSLPDSSWVLVAGLREARRLERQLASARSRGARVCVNGSWAPDERLSRTTEPPWDLLVLNEQEASRAAARAHDPLGELAVIVPELVITRGERGAAALLGGRRLEVPAARPAAVVDPTGAGDAFCAGLLHALLQGTAPEEAVAYASKVAARVLSMRGGAVFDAALFDGLELPC